MIPNEFKTSLEMIFSIPYGNQPFICRSWVDKKSVQHGKNPSCFIFSARSYPDAMEISAVVRSTLDRLGTETEKKTIGTSDVIEVLDELQHRVRILTAEEASIIFGQIHLSVDYDNRSINVVEAYHFHPLTGFAPETIFQYRNLP